MSGDVSTAEQVDQPESTPEQKFPTDQPQLSPAQSPKHSIDAKTAEMMARSGAVSSPLTEGQTTRRGLLLKATAGVATAAAATGALYGAAQMANGGTSFPASETGSSPSFLSKIGSALRGFLPGFNQKHLDEMAKEAQAKTTPNIQNSGASQTTIVPSGLPDTGHP